WRLFTYPFFHFGFAHLLFNLLALVVYSFTFEFEIGTSKYLYILIPIFTVFPGIFATSIQHFLQIDVYTAGASGLIFSLIAWDCRQGPPRSFLGLFSIHRLVYPFFLLLIIQILAPNSSMLGHFSGIIFGFGFAYHIFDLIIPSTSFFKRAENKILPSALLNYKRYIRQDSFSTFNSTGGSVFSNPPTDSQNSISSQFSNLFRGNYPPLSTAPPTQPSSTSDSSFAIPGRTLGENPQK
ncbi:hypothetical protein AYI68_g886, partial [Smittium mucronatum]